MARAIRRTRNITLELGVAALEAKKRLELQGIEMPRKPVFDVPELPDDPTDLSDSQLMALFSKMNRWAEYMAAQMAAAEVDERYAENILDKRKALGMIGLSEKTVTAAKAKQFEDSDYLDAYEEVQRAYAFRKMVQMLYNNTERKASVISRELTRRVGREPRENRDARWSA